MITKNSRTFIRQCVLVVLGALGGYSTAITSSLGKYYDDLSDVAAKATSAYDYDYLKFGYRDYQRLVLIMNDTPPQANALLFALGFGWEYPQPRDRVTADQAMERVTQQIELFKQVFSAENAARHTRYAWMNEAEKMVFDANLKAIQQYLKNIMETIVIDGTLENFIKTQINNNAKRVEANREKARQAMQKATTGKALDSNEQSVLENAIAAGIVTLDSTEETSRLAAQQEQELQRTKALEEARRVALLEEEQRRLAAAARLADQQRLAEAEQARQREAAFQAAQAGEKLMLRKNNAATALQKIVRGKNARKQAKALRVKKAREKALKEHAATKMQSIVRMKQAQNKYKKLQKSTTKLQAKLRGTQDRKRVEALRARLASEKEAIKGVEEAMAAMQAEIRARDEERRREAAKEERAATSASSTATTSSDDDDSAPAATFTGPSVPTVEMPGRFTGRAGAGGYATARGATGEFTQGEDKFGQYKGKVEKSPVQAIIDSLIAGGARDKKLGLKRMQFNNATRDQGLSEDDLNTIRDAIDLPRE
ncbi:hypothetical protein FJ365_00015 [Candidatus Dependentiae bacterium]|nr:hypothetical protein [Candidatus Dependentiae bacterium]